MARTRHRPPASTAERLRRRVETATTVHQLNQIIEAANAEADALADVVASVQAALHDTAKVAEGIEAARAVKLLADALQAKAADFQRQAVVLARAGGMSIDDIAKALGAHRTYPYTLLREADRIAAGA